MPTGEANYDMSRTPLPTYYLSHGGGPWPYMKGDAGRMWDKNAYDMMETSLQSIPKQLGHKPSAILMISGHYEENVFAVTSHPNPPMYYDYGGFPAYTYKVKYSAPGSPELAQRVKQLVEAAGFKAKMDGKRGYDHGTFVPLCVMFPQADIPVVQLSLRQDYDPEAHFRVGQALAPLRLEGVLIVGSGSSYHNLRGLFNPKGRAQDQHASKEFDDWLQETIAAKPEVRYQRLLSWAQAPSARSAHPREDHLMPLHVVVGAAANDAGQCIYHEDKMFGVVTVSSFKLG